MQRAITSEGTQKTINSDDVPCRSQRDSKVDRGQMMRGHTSFSFASFALSKSVCKHLWNKGSWREQTVVLKSLFLSTKKG